MSIYTSPFDQFQRYYTVKEIVGRLAQDKKVKVLEVGANAHCKLREFLPQADIVFTDIDDQPVPKGVTFIKADATDLPFNDDEFDFVVSTDVLEHVPFALREKFILECYRVSKTAFILACPIDNGMTTEVEIETNETFKRLLDQDFIWLKEHIDEGLPSVDFVNEIAASRTIPFVQFEHGRLDWWESLMKMHFIKEAEPVLRSACSAVDEYYNRNLYREDFGGACYRSFWVLGLDSLNEDIFELPAKTATNYIEEMEYYKKICFAAEAMALSLKELRHNRNNIQKELEDINQANAGLVASNAHLNEANADLVASNAHLNEVILALKTSTSWRLTAPLRAVSYLAKGDRQAFKKAIFHRFPLIERLSLPEGGGFKGRIKRAATVLVKEGPSAFLRRLVKPNITNVPQPFDPNNAHHYQEWLDYHAASESIDSNEIMNSLFDNDGPLISVVMPTYNTNEKFLRLCIESVCNQSYSNWELCIADDASTQPQVKKVLDEYQKQDPRIKVVYRKENGHISAATNSAIDMASGEWLALLDHDDELHQHALAYVAHSILNKPNTEFVYSDEDKIDVKGNRSAPHFKPDWNLDLLYSQNYVSHLGVYKTEIVKKIGGFRVGYEGSQDYDLLLRYSREINHSNIVHIPKVLYHWRMIEGSTALASGEKSYTTEAGIKALKDFFNKSGELVKVEKGLADNIYKVTWPTGDDFVSLIIPTHNGLDITKQAISSIIEKTSYSNYEIILVDNNSDDVAALNYFNEISKHEKVTLLKYPHPFNYSAINNFAVKQCKGNIIGLINNDIEVINPGWLTEMVSHARRKDIGCVGAMLYYPNNKIQHAGVTIGLGGIAGEPYKGVDRGSLGYFGRLISVRNLTAVTAACLLVRREVYDQVNGLNERDLKVAYNDVDFCLKVAQAGYRNLWTPFAELYHHESISRGADDTSEKRSRFNTEVEYMVSKWDAYNYLDASYNPNLTLKTGYYDLAWPSRGSATQPYEKIKISTKTITEFSDNKKVDKVAVFCGYIGKIDEFNYHDKIYQWLKRDGYHVILVMPKSVSIPQSMLKKACDVFIERDNFGYDFGSYASGLQYVHENLDLKSLKRLLFVNDSIIGPFGETKPINDDADFWANTDSNQFKYHYQSYLFGFNLEKNDIEVVNDFFFRRGDIYTNEKKYVIDNFEMSMYDYFSRKGLTCEVTYPVQRLKKEFIRSLCKNTLGSSVLAKVKYIIVSIAMEVNTTHNYWLQLFSNGFPFLKKELVRDNPTKYPSLDEDLRKAMSTKSSQNEYIELLKPHK